MSQTSLPPRSESRGQTKPTPAKGKKPKKVKKRKRGLSIFLGVFAGLLILVAAALGYVVLKTTDAIDNISSVSNNDEGVKVPVAESVKKKPVAMVLMGLDSRSHGGGLNTDVMMVAAFDPETKKATVVSIPRDTYIAVEGYKGRKANSIYAAFYSDAKSKGADTEKAQLAGKKAVSDVLGKLFEIDIKYAGIINFQGFSDVVDAVGGVKVNVDMRMKYTDNADGTKIDLQPGIQNLDGDKALDFVRYRKSNDGRNMSSDFDRNRRQSEVIGAIVDKLTSLGGAAKIGSVIEAVGNNIRIDMPSREITRMLETYYSVRSDDITFLALDGVWRSPYVYADETSLANVRTALKEKMGE
ncbi:transcriptional regulator [Paenibacillus sp. MY03]|jgi:LCP family protein required for cell wall assembly|uniref:Transcriptional regulator n=1 Tax=Paenibacillus agaridevorans TaxID=171404 RepID=A0A2R5EQU1_9BACL|nr:MULTISPECIES: LCP family protein [Paenibacillus]OUS76821.1 transcriptional regulator [Paenibacillus sp. MY03]GBG06133.1 transcriptional regulator [Paenibacillus agaridevorans]